MASVSLRDGVEIRGLTTRNRICIPPMVCYGCAGADGRVTDAHVNHYRAFAQGGAGLIIQEATAVTPGGRLSMDQLGIWSEEQLPGLKRITEAVHGFGCPILVQLHHGGIMSCGSEKLCPGSYRLRREKKPAGQDDPGEIEVIHGQKMSQEEIKAVRDAFVSGAVRAWQAGYDGVELHGCHSYLLCQFLNSRVNTRQDEYGDGMTLILEILGMIRQRVSPDFVVGIRLGGFEPTLADGISHALRLKEAGIDFLDISYGFAREMVPEAPGDNSLKPIHGAAGAIKAATGLPVFVVDGITTADRAREVLEKTGVDMVCVGRSALVDPQWANHALHGEAAGKCLGCRDCQWRHDPQKCPGRILMKRGVVNEISG